jgi:hypothetical protein
MKYVLDASDALKWVLPEADSDKAIRLQEDFSGSSRSFRRLSFRCRAPEASPPIWPPFAEGSSHDIAGQAATWLGPEFSRILLRG